MEGYEASTYGDRFAAEYDRWFADRPPADAAIELLRAYAGAGPALEIGVGTGRFAIPLARTGVSVIGLDVSARMLDVLATRAAGLPVTPVLGDAADFRLDEPVPLAYCVFNTFLMLAGEAEQRRCLAAVRDVLRPGGHLVLEAFVPEPERYPEGQSVRVRRLTAGEVVLHVAVHDEAAQVVEGQDVVLSEAGVQLFPTRVRYLWPAQLDALATEAGLTPRHRYGGWDRQAAGPDSRWTVAVYERG